VAGAAVAAALSFPASRRQTLRVVRAAVDELAVRAETGWSRGLLLVTTEGRHTGFPRTVVLAGVDHDGETYVLPWLGSPDWLANLSANPEVVVDDRTAVRRARAEVVDGEAAESVRRAALERLPAPLTRALQATGVALRSGSPAVRFTVR
jgi:deazaflavin-dependent oxidoreductase (nitroreductase family)